MKISKIDFIYESYHHFHQIRSKFIHSALTITKDTRISLYVDHEFFFELESKDDVCFVSNSIQNILFELAFEADKSLRCFCLDHDLDYDPITDKLYLDWFSSKHQSK